LAQPRSSGADRARRWHLVVNHHARRICSRGAATIVPDGRRRARLLTLLSRLSPADAVLQSVVRLLTVPRREQRPFAGPLLRAASAVHALQHAAALERSVPKPQLWRRVRPVLLLDLPLV